MHGNPVTEDLAALIAAMKNGPEEEQWTMEREECVTQLVQHCKQLLLTDEEECMCGWALVDPFYRYRHDAARVHVSRKAFFSPRSEKKLHFP